MPRGNPDISDIDPFSTKDPQQHVLGAKQRDGGKPLCSLYKDTFQFTAFKTSQLKNITILSDKCLESVVKGQHAVSPK